MAGMDACSRSRSRRYAVGSALSLILFGVGVLGAAILARTYRGPEAVKAQVAAAPARAAGKAPASPTADKQAPDGVPQIVAVVNGEQITRHQLSQECLRYGGEDVLETIVNRHLIAAQCKQLNIAVTEQEIQGEIARMAQRFNLSVDQWLKLLETERGIKPQQYAKDILWPTLALRKLVGPQLEVTAEELQQEYEAEFGAAIKARIIVISDPQKATTVHAQAKAKPDDFARLAREHSEDVNSASAGGLIQPIRRHVGDKQIEEVAFRLQEGQVSPILRIGDQHVFLRCEGVVPPRNVRPEDVRERHVEQIRDRKLPQLASELFRKLQSEARVENVYNDPGKRARLPDAAALVNGQVVAVSELAAECLTRQGKEVLEAMINRKLLEHQLKQKGLVVTKAELDEEIARAAVTNDIVTPDGKPDLPRWLKMVTEQSGVSVDIYVADAVWPTVALKKLVSGQVQVSAEDLQKGFEANYGPRVRCRAIVLANQRLAQQVWDMARKTPTVENFAQLAEQYSVEVGGRSQGGEVPPIQRHGGQPVLEAEAFKLRPGEISGIIQVADKFVILYCEGQTEPSKVRFDEVKALIQEDILEKKLRLAMAQEFDRIKDHAHVDNFLAGTTRSPKQQATAEPRSGSAPGGVRQAAGPAPNTAVRPATATRPVR